MARSTGVTPWAKSILDIHPPLPLCRSGRAPSVPIMCHRPNNVSAPPSPAHTICRLPGGGGGGRLPTVLMRHPPQLSVKTRGGGGVVGGGGGRLGGVGGDFGRGGGFPGGGGLRATHYYHMHTAWGVVCLRVWGYGGMYAIIALSHHCREESLKGRRVAPLPPPPSPLPPPLLFPRAPTVSL